MTGETGAGETGAGGAVPEPGALRRGAAQRQADGARAAALQAGLEAEGIRRVAITFVNHAGAPLVKVVPLSRLTAVVENGVGFSPVSDAWTIDGLPGARHPLSVPDGDLRLVPDPEALLLLDAPGGWAWVPGERFDREGLAHPADQRSFCRRMAARLEAAELQVRAGFELEWLVGLPGEEPGLRPALPGGPYGADRLMEGLDYAAAVTDAFDAAGLPWLQFHPEYGPAQFELSLAPADPLTAADRMVAARLLVQRVTRRFGWRCSFSPLPDPTRVGNGGHLHLSVQRQGQPLFQGGEGPGGLTAAGAGVLASLLSHLPALLPIACPLAVSYRRLGPGRWSAPFQAWGIENREAALRLIPTAADGAAAHLECKVADPAANPYLLVGSLLALVAEGLERPAVLPDPVRGDPSLLAAPPPRLPLDLEAASDAFSRSTVLREAMGEGLHGTLVASQQAEVERASRLDPEALVASTCWLPLVGP